jgi:bacterioferritin-associated ferredoxin
MSTFKNNIIGRAFRHWHKAKRSATFARIRAAVASRHFAAKPLFMAALSDIYTAADGLARVQFAITAQHTYHSLDEFSDVQVQQRETKAKAELEACFDGIELRVQTLCKAVSKQARLYQESVRTMAELLDTTGVELECGQSVSRSRAMVLIKHEKVERSRTYRRLMQEESLLANFVRLVDYVCSETVMARVIDNVADIVGQLRFCRAIDSDKLPKGTFVSFVDFTDEGMSFLPTEASVRDAIQHNVIDGAAFSCMHLLTARPRFRLLPWYLRKPCSVPEISPHCQVHPLTPLETAVQNVYRSPYRWVVYPYDSEAQARHAGPQGTCTASGCTNNSMCTGPNPTPAWNSVPCSS